MFNHAPEDYRCPFCAVVRGDFNPDFVWSRESDVIVRTPLAVALIAADSWPNNSGNALVIPSEHFENIYDLPLEFATEIHRLARALALAMKTVYRCDGISTRQHNEPAGNQDVWHFHTHVFARYANDDLYKSDRQASPEVERAIFAQRLRDYLELHPEVLS